MKYLTLQQYKNFDDGILSPDVTNVALAGYIVRAETAIDRHMGFDLKVGGFEPHQTWIQRKWKTHSLRTTFPSFPIPIRNITRYRIQVSNISGSGAGYFATIAPSDATINEGNGYVEIVPLQSVVYSLTPLLLALGLKDPLVQMDCEVGFYLPSFGEVLLNSGDNKTYFAVRGFWAQTYTQAAHVQPNQLPPIPPVIYKNGAVVTTGFTINYTEGQVIFAPGNNNTDVITADYTTQIPDGTQSAAIEQVSYLLGKRQLNKWGMNGLALVMNGDQRIQRPIDRGKMSGTQNDVLCAEAAKYLSRDIKIAIA